MNVNYHCILCTHTALGCCDTWDRDPNDEREHARVKQPLEKIQKEHVLVN